jgi:hypothetical protein
MKPYDSLPCSQEHAATLLNHINPVSFLSFLQLIRRVILVLISISFCTFNFYVMIKAFRILLLKYLMGFELGLYDALIIFGIVGAVKCCHVIFHTVRGTMWQYWFGTNGDEYVLLEPIQ